MVHLAAWSGMRAAELAGLQVGDLEWPVNPNGQVYVRVRRTVIDTGDGLTYDTTKTKGSDRHVPLMPHSVQLLRDYLASHPRGDDPSAPLFFSVTLTPVKPTGKRQAVADCETPELASDSTNVPARESKPETAAEKAERQALVLAALSLAQTVYADVNRSERVPCLRLIA